VLELVGIGGQAASSSSNSLAGADGSGAVTHDAGLARTSGTYPGVSGGTAKAAAHSTAPPAAPAPAPQQKQDQPALPQQVSALRFTHLVELLLLPPDVAAVAQQPAAVPRLAALLLLGLEQAGGSSTPGSSAGQVLVSVYWSWLLPCVLQPLLSPAVAAAWQQQQQAAADGSSGIVSTAYWRTALLLYASAVRVLGLAAVRKALPSWHTSEVN